MSTARSALRALTERELEVLQAWAEGQSLKQVSVSLDISIGGVSFHLRNIYKKLHVNTAREAVRIYHAASS